MDLSSISFDQSHSEFVGADAFPDARFCSTLPPSHGKAVCSDVRSDSLQMAPTTNSPSIGSAGGAFEIKFVVDDNRAEAIKAWARDHLVADPHADGKLGDSYHVNTLYLDTPDFQTFHRVRFFRRRKFRLRRYGRESLIWMELKRKRDRQVRKRRVCVSEVELEPRLTQPWASDWEGAWFRRRLDGRQLRPACQVTYRRFARVGTSVTGPIRLTVDRDLYATDAAEWRVPDAPFRGKPLFEGRQIVEMKFREVLPAMFRALIQDLHLQPATFSKYRESIAACIPLSRLSGEDASEME